MANLSTVHEVLVRILYGDAVILMTDEAQVHLSGCQQKMFHYWSAQSIYQLQQRSRDRLVTVECVVGNLGATGPYVYL